MTQPAAASDPVDIDHEEAPLGDLGVLQAPSPTPALLLTPASRQLPPTAGHLAATVLCARRTAAVRESLETKGRIAVTPKTTLMGVPKAVVNRGRYFVMALEYGGAPSLPRGLPSPPPGVIVYTVFITAKQWQPIAAALAADPVDQMVVEGFVYYDEALETLALLAQSATTLKTQKKTLTAKEAPAPAISARPALGPAPVVAEPAVGAPTPSVEVLVRRRSG
jgi:hypothetical protein